MSRFQKYLREVPSIENYQLIQYSVYLLFLIINPLILLRYDHFPFCYDHVNDYDHDNLDDHCEYVYVQFFKVIHC